jgi:hypothetical protein
MQLSAKTIAQRQGVSERCLHLLFEQNGNFRSRYGDTPRAFRRDPNENDKPD